LWWFNLSSPNERITPEEQIILNLNGTSNNEKVGKITLHLDEDDWYGRIKKGSHHDYKGTDIIKVHVLKERGKTEYCIYFGKKTDGYYAVSVKTED